MNKEKKEQQEKAIQDIGKAISLLKDLLKNNPQIESSIWVSAMNHIIVNIYIQSGNSYKVFEKYTNKTKEYYKSWFEK